jgi:micrococcal nuclease
MTLRKRLIILIILALSLSACSKVTIEVGYESVKLVRVVDGDTLVINRANKTEYVRLIGIDAPESVHPDPSRNTEDGKRSSQYLKDLLKNINVLYLVKDVSETDKYGRLLRYVWLSKPHVDDEAQIRKNMVNAIILLNGYAVNVTIQPDINYARLFLGFVREARNNHTGLWD